MTETSSDYALDGQGGGGGGGGKDKISQGARAAATYAKSAASQVATMAESGPLPLRVLAFLGGVFMIVASIIDSLRGLVHLDFIHVLVSVYVCLFGLLICVLEGTAFLPPWVVAVQLSLHDQARFLRFRWGRGILFFFAGSLQFSHWSMLNVICGGFMMFLGIVSILTGRRAANKLAELRRAIPDEAALQREFTAFDSVNGFLHLDDFANLVKGLGLDFGRNEVEAAFAAIDKDNDGQISFEDFKAWWSGSEADGMPYAQV